MSSPGTIWPATLIIVVVDPSTRLRLRFLSTGGSVGLQKPKTASSFVGVTGREVMSADGAFGGVTCAC